jgi:hypothetical protein
LDARLMPKIPIIRSPEYEDRTANLGDGPEPLAPEQSAALKAIEDRTARIDRELAVSQAWRAGVERLSAAEKTPGGAPVGFTRGFLDDLDRERQQVVTSLPPAGQAPLERDLLDLRADFLDRAAQVEASGMALRRRTALYDALDGYVAGVTRDLGQVDRATGRMDSLIAGLGLPEKGEAWVVDEAVQGIGKGAGQVHKVVKPGKTTYAAEETTLFMSHKEPLAADVLKTGRPLGLTNDANFAAFKKILREERATLPPDTRFAIRGSAVTGNGFDQTAQAYTKDYFDVGRTSDHDIAIVSRTLFEKAQSIGVELRQGGSRTDVLRKKKDTVTLGLSSLLDRIQKLTGREDTKLMIYKSVNALNKHGASVQFDLK